MIYYIKKIVVFCCIVLLAQSCNISTGHILHRYGQTKKIKTNSKLNSDDTLVVIVPFLQEIPIEDYKTAMEIKENLFKKNIPGINYNTYKWFYSEPDTWVQLSKKHKEGIEITSPTYYQKYFESPIQKLLNKRIHYFVTKIDDISRKNSVEEELGEIEKKLRNNKVKELVISDKMCEQLKFYNKRYYLITDILDYDIDYRKCGIRGGDVEFVWFRMLILDIVSKKVILYRNISESFWVNKGTLYYDVFCELKHFVKKIKHILPKKNKHEK